MILADKILNLRKQNGWSQEELAEKMKVSRQSISKWESAASIPDIGKILELARLFGVSTDYLLMDEMSEPVFSGNDSESPLPKLSLEGANEFFSLRRKYGWWIALGACLCVISPIALILLSGMADTNPDFPLSVDAAGGVGIVLLLLMVAFAVTVFIISGAKLSRYNYLNEGNFDTEYGVIGAVSERRAAYENIFLAKIITGVVLCILSVVPLLIAGIVGAEDMTLLYCTSLLLATVAIAVYLFITAGMVKGGYDIVLMEGDYNPKTKIFYEKSERLGGAYWPIVTAIYLGVSFITRRWDISWLVWPIGALIFVGIKAWMKTEDN